MHKKQAQVVDLRPAMDLSRSLLEALPVVALAFDVAGRIVHANQSAQSLFGKGEKALTGLGLGDVLDDSGAVMTAARLVIRTGRLVTLHDAGVGEQTAHSVSIGPLDNAGLFFMSMHMHAPHLKTAWTHHVRETLAPARLLVRTLAHEIKNPLSGIQGAAQLLSSANLSGDDAELLSLIARESSRILRLVQKVDVFEPVAPEHFTPVNVHEVLSGVVRVARASFASHLTIVEKYDPSLPSVRGDFDSLVQAVMNLIKNAAEAAPDGGRIALRTFYDTMAAAHSDNLEKLPVCIEIGDNGAGIAPETLARIFDPWFTTKQGGEGLGLAVVSRVIDDHGGAVDVKSDGEGTVFRLSFPMDRSV